MKQNMLLKMSIISLLALTVSPFDLFLFNRFYADGKCKTKEDLSKYVIQGHTTTNVEDDIRTLKRDEMITIELLRQDAESIKFGIIFSDSKKKSLWSAHEFFKIIEKSTDKNEKAIFPDLISCVIDTSFIYSFGLFDSYGLIYALSPTMYEYRMSQVNMTSYNFLDLLNIFLDIFKAMKVVFRHNFYLKKFNELDIGISQIVSGPNVQIKGKLRRLHLIRKANLCNPSKMRTYKEMHNSYLRFNKIENYSRNIDLNEFQTCQNINLHDIWKLMIEKYTVNHAASTGQLIDFADCVSGVTPLSDCPDDFEFLWQNQEYRTVLMQFTRTGLRYKTNSILNFLINLIESIKNHYLKKKVVMNLNIIAGDVEHKKQTFTNIAEEQNEILNLDESLLKLVPADKKIQVEKILNDKEKEIKNEMIHGDHSHGKDIITMKKVMEDPMRDMEVVEEVKKLVGKDNTQAFTDLENQKEKILNLELTQIHEMEVQLIAKKTEIRKEYLEVEQASLQKAGNMAKNVEIYKYELQLIQLVKESNGKSFIDVMKENPDLALKVQEEWSKRGINFSLDKEEKSKDSIDKEEIPSEHSHDESESSVTASVESSEEDLSVDQLRNQDLLGIKMYDAFKRDELELEDLTMDFDEDTNHLNFDLLTEAKQETKSGYAQDFIKEKFGVDVSQKGIEGNGVEENVLINYQKAADVDEAMAIKHSLKAKILREASLGLEFEELQKLTEVEKIIDAKEKIIELKNENTSDNREAIKNLEIVIQSKTASMVQAFGELDDVGVLGDGVRRMSMEDVADDFSVFQLEEIPGFSFLEQMDENMRIII
jgi:hypothetical protein